MLSFLGRKKGWGGGNSAADAENLSYGSECVLHKVKELSEFYVTFCPAYKLKLRLQGSGNT